MTSKHLYLALILAVAFTCCTTTKDVLKTKTNETVKTEVHAVETATATETFTTDVSVPESTISGVKDVGLILSGDSIFEETPEISIVTKIDKTGKIQTRAVKKAQKVAIPGTRVTVTNKVSDTRSEEKKQVTTKDKHVKRDGINFNYLWWLLLLLIIPIWKFRKLLF
nr:hypothetical protein [uncultured Flavobacterium sp.]